MPRSGDVTASLLSQVQAERATLKTLATNLRNAGDRELGAAVDRAYRELASATVTGIENIQGVNSGSVRK